MWTSNLYIASVVAPAGSAPARAALMISCRAKMQTAFFTRSWPKLTQLICALASSVASSWRLRKRKFSEYRQFGAAEASG
eukprot:3365879-Pyramimonas_sp.AAC.1